MGISFKAGEGVGTVTRGGLPIPPGEPAINPGASRHDAPGDRRAGRRRCRNRNRHSGWRGAGGKDLEPDGLASSAGLSILGTTGIVHPFSCSAWIASIHRGVDVARAMGLTHVAGCTGSTSEDAVQGALRLAARGDARHGGFRRRPPQISPRPSGITRVTIGGGFGKMVKLAQGALDLHSGRSQVDLEWLAGMSLRNCRASAVLAANTAHEVLEMADDDFDLPDRVAAQGGGAESCQILRGAQMFLPISSSFRRSGEIIAHAG